ncbi:helix-turn-helix transcriptional regulator [Gluconobacter oxydans]|uniref:helix-turn-helix transcriptional regulator n=1 Tax=Gluconobacter oxydans TaxID=442 RepID=UPI0039EC73A6
MNENSESADTVGKRLKLYRKRANLTQKAVANAVGVSIPTVSEWEHDKKIPDKSRWSIISETLHTTSFKIFDVIPSLKFSVSDEEKPHLERLIEEYQKISDFPKEYLVTTVKASLSCINILMNFDNILTEIEELFLRKLQEDPGNIPKDFLPIARRLEEGKSYHDTAKAVVKEFKEKVDEEFDK